MSKDATKICDFPDNMYPIDMHCFMKSTGGIKRQNIEQILLTLADGTVPMLQFESTLDYFVILVLT